jgi:hypothetical protein
LTQTATATSNKPAWVELSTPDVEASRTFYSRIFGWQIDVSPDPQYGGYAMAKLGAHDAAGIGPKQSADAPTAWGLYIGTENVDELAQRVEASGGTVIAPPFDVGDQGRMAVFQDPAGALISAWQPTRMGGFELQGSNGFAWAELNARSIEKVLPFYERVFGWTTKRSPVPGGPDYFEFQVDGKSIAGGTELNPQVPAGTASHWLVYFGTDDVDGTYQKAMRAGGREMLPPQDYPGGRFAILSDPQGGSFGLLQPDPNQR